MSFWNIAKWVLNPIGMAIGKSKEKKLLNDLKNAPPNTIVSGGSSLGFTPLSFTNQSFNPIAQKEFEWQLNLNQINMDSILNPNQIELPTNETNISNVKVPEVPNQIDDSTKVVDDLTADVVKTIVPTANVIGKNTLELNNNTAIVGIGLIAFILLLKK